MGNHCTIFPRKSPMNIHEKSNVLSYNPANARRHLSGQGGVKCATGLASATHQATPQGISYSGAPIATTPSANQLYSIGTWNVRGLIQDGKLSIVESEMKRKEIDILGLSETHWRGSGHFTSDLGNTVYFSGPENESNRGVAFLVPPLLNKCVLGYKPINERILSLKLNAKPCRLNIIQVYAPTAQSTEEEIETFYGILSATLRDIPKREVTMVIGDLNAKVGVTLDDNHLRQHVGLFGIGERNERGERLLQFCIEENFTLTNTCFQQHIRRLYTWISPGNRFRNQIDYIMIQTRWRSSILNSKTYPGADCGSDHQLLMCTFKLRLRKSNKQKPMQNFKKVHFSNFRTGLEKKLAAMTTQNAGIYEGTKSWEALRDAIIDQATKNKIQSAGTMKGHFKAETAKIILDRRALKEKGVVSEEDQKRYSELSGEVQRRCRKDFHDYINNICCELERHAVKKETNELFQKVRELSKSKSIKTWAVADKNGNLLSDLDTALKRWREYCEELYSTKNTAPNVYKWDTINDREPFILDAEIEQAIKSLKNDKSPGKDSIPAELLKAMGPIGKKIVAHICNSIWATGVWPEDWTESVFVPLHKKGPKSICSNYRTISLISHASKVMLHVLNQRLRNFLDRQIPEEQAGFVKGKGTREQILNIRQIIEKSREFTNPVLLCFIDYSKAFDCVIWDKLWPILVEMGVPPHLVSLIANLYNHNRSYVRLDGSLSNVFMTKKGVRQGCILSPLLFNIYGEYIMRKTMEDWNKGFHVGGKRLANLRYADDTVLLASSYDDMSKLLHKLETESKELGLLINRSKTKLMVVDRGNKLPTACSIPGIDVVEHYIYLGSLISNDGTCVSEIKRRIAIAKDAMSRLTNIWRNRSITNNTKLRLVHALIFPIFLYGVETWTIRARERQRIDAFEMWCWRRMLRIPWTAKRTNISILKQLKIINRLSTTCLRRILGYFGHISRRGNESIEKLIIVGNVEGRRPRGRSPTRWSDQIKETGAQTLYDAVRMASDRTQWRKIIYHNITRSHGDHDPQS